MKYLHAMIRVDDVEASLHFYQELLGLKLVRRKDSEKGKFTLYYLATEEGEPEIELTHNWGGGEYISGNAFGHLAFPVDNIYELCQKMQDVGVTILRPPRDGHMAFVRSPDNISIEILQKGYLEPKEPWVSMPNTGKW